VGGRERKAVNTAANSDSLLGWGCSSMTEYRFSVCKSEDNFLSYFSPYTLWALGIKLMCQDLNFCSSCLHHLNAGVKGCTTAPGLCGAEDGTRALEISLQNPGRSRQAGAQTLGEGARIPLVSLPSCMPHGCHGVLGKQTATSCNQGSPHETGCHP